MTPTQRKAVGGTLLFVGAGAVVLMLMKSEKPQTYLLHYGPLDEAHVDSVFQTLESHGTVREFTWAGDDSLFVRWTPHEVSWEELPTQHHADLLLSQEIAAV